MSGSHPLSARTITAARQGDASFRSQILDWVKSTCLNQGKKCKLPAAAVERATKSTVAGTCPLLSPASTVQPSQVVREIGRLRDRALLAEHTGSSLGEVLRGLRVAFELNGRHHGLDPRAVAVANGAALKDAVTRLRAGELRRPQHFRPLAIQLLNSRMIDLARRTNPGYLRLDDAQEGEVSAPAPATPISHARLVLAAMDGSAFAMQALLGAESAPVERFATKQLPQPEDGKDVAQESLYRMAVCLQERRLEVHVAFQKVLYEECKRNIVRRSKACRAEEKTRVPLDDRETLEPAGSENDPGTRRRCLERTWALLEAIGAEPSSKKKAALFRTLVEGEMETTVATSPAMNVNTLKTWKRRFRLQHATNPAFAR